MALDILAGIGLLAGGDMLAGRLGERRAQRRADREATERDRQREEQRGLYGELGAAMGLEPGGIDILRAAGAAGEGGQVLADKLARRSPAEQRAAAAEQRAAELHPGAVRKQGLDNQRAEFDLQQARMMAANPVLDPAVRQERQDYINAVSDGAFIADRSMSALGALHADNPLAAQAAIVSLLLTLTGKEANLRGDGMIGRMGDAQGVGDAIVNAWNKMLGEGFSDQSKLEFEQTLASVVAPSLERLLRTHDEWEQVEQMRGLPRGSITTGAGVDLNWTRNYLQVIRDEGIYRPWEGRAPDGGTPPPAQAPGLGYGTRLRGWWDDWREGR